MFQGIMMRIDHPAEPKEFVVSKGSEFARVGRKGKFRYAAEYDSLYKKKCLNKSEIFISYRYYVFLWQRKLESFSVLSSYKPSDLF
jgi:hypothetical protein